jgi:DNA-binding GntR family transcriptional regulator
VVADSIREAILRGDYAPNQWLVEADLSVRFDASRGTIRSALVHLASEGVVERIQNRGARVREVTLEEAIEISEVRMVVEALCAGKAADRATAKDCARLRGIGTEMKQAVAEGDLLRYSELNRQLHAQIRQISGQNTATAVLERLRGQNIRHQFRLALHPGRATVSLPQHLAMIDAICAGDAAAAEMATRAHLASVIETLPAVAGSVRPR